MAYLSSLFYPVSTVPIYNSTVINTAKFDNMLQVKQTGGNLLTVTGFTTATNMQYIQIYNSSVYPPVTQPVSISVVPEFSNFNISFNSGLPLSNGILIVVSTTPRALTPALSSAYITAVYK